MADRVALLFVAYRVTEAANPDGITRRDRRPLMIVKGDTVTECAKRVSEGLGLPLDVVLLVPAEDAPLDDILRLSSLLAAEFYLMQFALVSQAQGRVVPAGFRRLVT